MLLAGLETGVVAGSAVLLYWMLATTLRGEGPWAVLNLMGSALFHKCLDIRPKVGGNDGDTCFGA